MIIKVSMISECLNLYNEYKISWDINDKQITLGVKYIDD